MAERAGFTPQLEQEAGMAGDDRFENDTEHGHSSFIIGLLTGTMLGAGLAILFAPKGGAALRNQLSEQAGQLANTASEGYRRARATAHEWAEKGLDAYDAAREAVTGGIGEAETIEKDATRSESERS